MSLPFRHLARFVPVLVLALFGTASAARSDSNAIAAICDSAAAHVARESNVPLDVLRAISLTETGRKRGGALQPWPWTVNMEGVGKWFDDFASARSYVDRHFARGARSFDVGCFQINYKWHGRAFRSIDDMFDPITNARYAAKFLTELYEEFGDWSKAAGAYHSRTPKYARKYSARFDRIRAGLPEPAVADPPVIARLEPVQAPAVPDRPPRKNTYPFLVLAGRADGPSLVPLAGRGAALMEDGARPFLDIRR